MKNLPFIVKVALKPLSILILLIIFSFVGLPKSFYQIGASKEDLTKVKKVENILKSKLDLVNELQDNVQKNTGYVVSFLPEENPAIYVLYQLRSLAAQGGLYLYDFQVGSEIKESNDFNKILISFNIDAPIIQILGFADSIKTISPNLWIEKTEIELSGEIAKARFTTKSYWSDFPKKIPAVSDPIASISAKEEEILSKISAYRQHPFTSVTDMPSGQNLNPFGE